MALAPDESLCRTGTFQLKASSPSCEWMVDVLALTWIPFILDMGCSNSHRNIEAHNSSLVAAAKAMYSASTELFTTVCCRRKDQLHVNPSTVKTYPVVDLLQSREPAQSLSAHPESICPPAVVFVNRLTLVVPLRYLRIRLAAVRCSLDGFATNQAHLPMAKVMSSLLP